LAVAEKLGLMVEDKDHMLEALVSWPHLGVDPFEEKKPLDAPLQPAIS
jgi:hypothetical protein